AAKGLILALSVFNLVDPHQVLALPLVSFSDPVSRPPPSPVQPRTMMPRSSHQGQFARSRLLACGSLNDVFKGNGETTGSSRQHPSDAISPGAAQSSQKSKRASRSDTVIDPRRHASAR
ncbi:hypothetical protein CLAIMM_14283, partial [Cladophialophora immunda]